MSDMINSITFVDSTDGASIQYDGPFKFSRDGGSFEIPIPVDPDDYAGIHEGTAENLSERDGDFLIARVDADVKGSGVIEAAEIIEGKLLIRVNDGNYVTPSEVDVDLSDVRGD